MTQRLELALFKTVVASTPLISIDLVVYNAQGQVLLGQRLNRPAKGDWFVPGGRICKDESMAVAFSRLVQEELGLTRTIQDAQFIGPFEHFYSDNFSGVDFSTHYVVLGYRLQVDIDLDSLPQEQHHHYRWFDVSELLASDEVHLHTKWYFMNGNP